MSDWYLYMIRCRNGSLYTGISTDVGLRFTQHQGKGGTGSKYLKGKGPLSLVFEKKMGSKSLALKVEGRIKKLPKAKKERLVGYPVYIKDIVKQARAPSRQ
jgi:putative endonuclease